ncbi:hypothetical protein B296_00015753 [Ensete ventricosum]|uniref:Uncharacterized protein n=1 Tax=Ensete ventricosum TaxID=4639 RepID=A0A426YQL6_ENSVE|nr:hypothetical protein B296_00015753 [Ensete ventricosum]
MACERATDRPVLALPKTWARRRKWVPRNAALPDANHKLHCYGLRSGSNALRTRFDATNDSYSRLTVTSHVEFAPSSRVVILSRTNRLRSQEWYCNPKSYQSPEIPGMTLLCSFIRGGLIPDPPHLTRWTSKPTEDETTIKKPCTIDRPSSVGIKVDLLVSPKRSDL